MMFNILSKPLLFFLLVFFYACNENSNDYNDSDDNDIVDYTLITKNITISQVIDGVTESRSVIIQTPTSIDTTKDYPIVFAFHGNGGSNTSWVNRLNSYTNNGDFIGIYPQGHLQSWNLGREASTANDVAFVNLIVEELEKYNNLDFDKMYAIGTSNGSGMVNKLGIETAHFKAIAPVVSQLMESSPLLPSTQPVSVFQINGAADTTIPINGGAAVMGHVFLDAAESAALWANHFSCNQNPEIQTLGEDTLYIYVTCNNDKEIRYLRIENGGHNLNLNLLFQDIWEFFQRF